MTVKQIAFSMLPLSSIGSRTPPSTQTKRRTTMAPVHYAGKTSRPNLKSATGKTANNNWIIVSIVAAVETPLALP